MTVVWLLIPLALALAGGALLAFLWGVGNGQFDDLDTPARRVLHDDDRRDPRR
jgi:cbb3-type cytochrome oxidase maturation protein